MKFGPVKLTEAAGKVLGHNVAGADGRRVLRKGLMLAEGDIELLRELGRESIYVAELELDDVDEDSAAFRIANSVMGSGLVLAGPTAGRANLVAEELGLLRVDVDRVTGINKCAGITLATMSNNLSVQARKIVATVKVIPFAVAGHVLEKAEEVASKDGPIIEMSKIEMRDVALILSGSPEVRDRITRDFEPSIRSRLRALNATISSVVYVTLEDYFGEIALAEKIESCVAGGALLLILAGETAIVDRHDITPRAIERVGGEVVCYGVPVDPGHLLLLGYVGGTPVLGAPGCTRSQKTNVIDWVLPRLLAGDRLAAADFVGLGHGGLLEEILNRPRPRSRL